MAAFGPQPDIRLPGLEGPEWVGFCRSLPFGLIRCTEQRYCSASGGNRPRLCENSDHNEAVGEIFNFPLRLAMKRDQEWDCASKSGGFVSIFPTGDMTPDFSDSLGH